MNPRELRQIGRYRVRRFIAEGGMAWVFEVEDPTFEGRRLALKMLKPDTAAGDQFRRFESEARLLAGLDHPNIVTIFDLGRDEETGSYYFTMTLVDGPTLADKGILGIDECLPIFIDVLAGLSMLHERRIVHRDIKPANILLHEDGRAVLADLGIARFEHQSSELTKSLTAIGTIRFMSPEQARGHRVSPASDVLSMALTIYQTLTGRSIYDAVQGVDSKSGQSILFYLGSMSGKSGTQLPMTLPDDVPRSVRKVLTKACSLDAADRYQNAGEMRQALLEAVERASEPPARSRVAPTVLAGAAAALLLAIGVYWLANSSLGRTSPEELLRSIERLELSSAELVDRAQDLSPPMRPELIADAREGLSRAAIFVARGRGKLEAGEIDGAVELLEDAEAYYARACRGILDGDLGERGNAAAESARARAETLAIPESEQLHPEAFAELTARVAELGAAATDTGPCAEGKHELARLAVSAEVYAQAALLERDLSTEWPRLSARAQTAAEAARDEASRLPSNAAEYQEPMAEGRAALMSGEALLAEGRYPEARRAFGAAREAFETANRSAPAAQARAQVQAILGRPSMAAVREQRVVQTSLAEAEALYAEERWDEARTQYDALVKLTDSLVADRQQAAGALAAADAAEALRAAAIRRGAKLAAPAALERADDAHAKAREDLEAMRYNAAERGFDAAKSLYATAQREANRLIESARSVGASAEANRQKLLGAGDCASLPGSARGPCDEGTESLRLGQAAFQEHDAAAAEQSFNHANERFDAARAAFQASEANRPQPPYIASRRPEDQLVRVYRNSPVEFRVEARDPNAGDTLRYRWRVDDSNAGTDAPEFTYRGDRDAQVRVTVEDGNDGAAEAAWSLSFTNRRPVVALTPRQREIHLQVGEAQEFELEASDPDGEPVGFTFSIDGERVASEPRFRFVAREVGQFELVARATDPGGASGRATLRLIVEAAGDVRPPSLQTRGARPPETTPSSQPAARAGLAALREYEAAYEALDIDRLSEVWIMTRTERKTMAIVFADSKRIHVDLEVQSVYVEDESVLIEFDQRVRAGGARSVPGEPARMKATVVPRAGGSWVISSIQPRI